MGSAASANLGYIVLALATKAPPATNDKPSDLPQPAGDDSVYQVWVIDSRGLAAADGRSERISGGTFTAATAQRDPETGEFIVPVMPAINVQGAAAFAVTIEDDGGTWVSDLSRRLVIAELAS